MNRSSDGVDTDSAQAATGRVMTIICAAFCFAIVLYGVVVWTVFAPRGVADSHLPAVRFALLGAAGVELVVAMVWTRLRIRPAVEEPGPAFDPIAFQKNAIIGLAFAESAAIIGLVLVSQGAPPVYYLYTAVPALAVMGLVVIPPILQVVNRT